MLLDVTAWRAGGEEQLGTKPKQWLRDPADRLWLWKAATWNLSPLGEYRKGDDWAERVVTEIARSLDIPVATTELAERDGVFGTVSLSVLDPESERLVHGNELLAEIDVIGSDPHDRTGYTLEAVRRSLDGVAGSTAGSTAFVSIAGYLIVDAVVGNTDRHQENWAVIESSTGERQLAPSFDHASSLGFLLDDAARSAMLRTSDRNQTPEAWARRAHTRFERRDHPVRIAAVAIDMIGPDVAGAYLEALDQLDLHGIVARVPELRISEPAREFAVRVAEANRARILSHPTRTMGQ
jgi:hypothetical protein